MSKTHSSISVFGSSGYGKSFFVLFMLEKIYLEKTYTLIFDSKQEYSALTQLGFKKAIFTQNLLAALTPQKAVQIMQKNPRLLYSGYFLSLEEQQLLVNVFATAALYLGNCLFVVEEASKILENMFNQNLRYIYLISTEGRSQSVDSIWIFQRLASISKITLSQSNVYISFNIIEPNDQQRASSILNIPKEEIQILKPRNYIFYDARTGKHEKLTTQGLKLKTKHSG